MHLLHYFWGFDINTTAYRLDKYILTKELHTLALEEHILPSRATQLPYIPRRCEWTSIYSLRAAFKLELITDKRLIRVFVCRLIRISFLSRERKREFPPSWSGKFKQKIFVFAQFMTWYLRLLTIIRVIKMSKMPIKTEKITQMCSSSISNMTCASATVWPDGLINCSIFIHLLQWKLAK